MQEDASVPSMTSLHYSKQLSRTYKDIARNARINLDSIEEYARGLSSLDTALTAPSGSNHRRATHRSQTGAGFKMPLGPRGERYHDANMHNSSDVTDDELECMLISCLVVIVRHIVFAFRSAEHLERFSRQIRQYNEGSETQSILRIYITLDGSASNYHVCDLTNKQLSLLLAKGLYHEVDVPDTGMGYIHLVRFPLMAAVKLPFIESAGMQINVIGRVLTQTPEGTGDEVVEEDIASNSVPFSAKCDLPTFLKPIYDNIIISVGKVVTHTSYIGLPNAAELLYDSEKVTDYGLPLIGTLNRDTLKHYQFLTSSDFNGIGYYPVALSFIGYIFCSSSKADEFIRRYKQKTELVALISRSSAILTGTLKEQRLTANASIYTYEDMEFLKRQYSDTLASKNDALIRGDTEGDYYMTVSNGQIDQQDHNGTFPIKGTLMSTSQSRTRSISIAPPLQSHSQYLNKQPKQPAPDGYIPIFISNLECRYLPNEVSTVTLELVFGSYPVEQELQPVPATDGHAMWVGEAMTLNFNPYKIVPYIEFVLRGYDIKSSLCYSDVAILSLVSLFTTKTLQGWSLCRTVGQIYARVSTPLVDQAIISSMSVFTETGHICNLQHDTAGFSDPDSTTVYQFTSRTGYHNNYQLNNANDDSILSVISETADIDQHIRNISRFGPVTNDEDSLSVLRLSATRPVGGGSGGTSALKRQFFIGENEDDECLPIGNDTRTDAVLLKYGCNEEDIDRRFGYIHTNSTSANAISRKNNAVPQTAKHLSASSSSYEDESSSLSGFSVDLYTSLEKEKSVATRLAMRAGQQPNNNSYSHSTDDSEEGRTDNTRDGKQLPDKQWLLERAKDVFKRDNSSDESSDFDY